MAVEFTVTWMSESGNVCTDTGRAKVEQVKEWQETVSRAAAENDEITEIKIPTDNDGDWSDGTVRAILVEKIEIKAKRPAGWS